jgi:predicted transcriptional regulator
VALNAADGRMEELIGTSEESIQAATALLVNTQAARKQVEEVLTLKKTAVQRALEQLLEDAMA